MKQTPLKWKHLFRPFWCPVWYLRGRRVLQWSVTGTAWQNRHCTPITTSCIICFPSGTGKGINIYIYPFKQYRASSSFFWHCPAQGNSCLSYLKHGNSAQRRSHRKATASLLRHLRPVLCDSHWFFQPILDLVKFWLLITVRLNGI